MPLRAEGIRILTTNTVGHTEFQACGETVRLVSTCTKKQVSEKQESPATANAWRRECQAVHSYLATNKVVGGCLFHN